MNKVSVPSRGRQIYIDIKFTDANWQKLFPSPREANRFISDWDNVWLEKDGVFVPSRGRQVHIPHVAIGLRKVIESFRPLSR